MKVFIPLLIYLISIGSAEVLDHLAQLKENSLEVDESSLGKIATHRLSQMSHEDLVHQKFLLDILQHVNEPTVKKELLQFSTSQYEQLIGDESLYNGGIDDLMAQAVEMSRTKQLLGKNEIFTIAKDEHIRQMVGLYHLFVRSRDWDTLQRNIIHARIHVNGVLLVNSLLLAIRDRHDTQNLVMPGIHEILPELYLDEEVIRRAKAIDLDHLSTSQAIITETRHPGILDMIGINKLLHRTTHTVNPLDRRQLWMPWREMRLEIRARKMGDTNTHTHVSVRNNDRIVLPVTQSSNLVGEQGETRILTADTGFQSFMHSFINDLCIFENEIMRQNRQWTATGSNKADLTRVGLERNVGTMLERRIQQKGDQVERENTSDDHDASSVRNDFTHVENRRWPEWNKDINMPLNREQMDRRRDNTKYEDPNYIPWQQQEASTNRNVFYKRRMDQEDIWKSFPSDHGLRDRFVGAELPTTTADDKPLLYVSRNRQHSDAGNKMYSRDDQRNIDLDTNTGWNKQKSWGRARFDSNQDNVRTHFRDTTNRDSVNVRNSDEFENINPNALNQDNLNMGIGMGMPMDLNEQMDMHRQRMSRVDNSRRVDTLSPSKSFYNADDLQLNKLPQVDINNERLLKVGRRKWNQLYGATDNKQDAQSWMSEVDERRNPGINTQTRLNLMRQQDIQNTISNGRQMENPRMWSTVARGMGNIGIHVGPQFERQNDINEEEKYHSERSNMRRLYVPWCIGMQGTNRNTGIDMWHQRRPRSVTARSVLNRRRQHQRTREGELILHNLQQLVARINLERISLGLNDNVKLQDNTDTSHLNRQWLTNAAEGRFVEVEKRLQEIEHKLIHTIETKQMQDPHDPGSVDRMIGEALMEREGADKDVNILTVLREIIRQTEDVNGGVQKLAHVTMNVGDPTVLHLLQRIVRIADNQRQHQLGSYGEDEIKMSGVTINKVEVDKLRTYIGTSDMDLINALGADHTLNDRLHEDQSQRMVVGRQQRLNHKSFAVKIDVTSDRNQRVVVRTFLGPKIDTVGQGIRLNDQRQNFILLDAYIADLHSGSNQIKRKSHDISWTSRDTTPFSEIYKRVMQALNGQIDVTLDRVQGQSCRFPHRLLLPHGRVDGLPMQMIVVITQVEHVEPTMRKIELDNNECTIGMSSENLDHLPLGFPLDRPIDDEDHIISLPNVQSVDVKIYHDNQLKVYDWMNDLYS